MRCQACGMVELVEETKDTVYRYQRESIILPEVKGMHCHRCGDYVLDSVEMERVSKLIKDFREKLDSRIKQVA